MRKSVIGILSGTLLLLGAFQNCGKLGFSTGGSDKTVGGGLAHLFASNAGSVAPTDGAPSLAVNAHPREPRKGASVVVTAIPQSLDAVSYSCASVARPEVILASGALSSDAMMFKLTVDADVLCTFKGVNAALDKTISVPFEINVDCGAQSRTPGGTCADYVCQSYAEIALSRLDDVPARTDAGICYYAKVMDAVAHAPSEAAAATDADVLARGAAGSAPPAILKTFAGTFTLKGPRTVKLAGSADTDAPVIVDDLLLIGLRAKDASPDVATDYRAFGAGAVTIVKDGVDGGAVTFKDVALPLAKFADDGVSSKTPIEITTFAEVNHAHALDLRALDAGGTAELSTVYLRFE